MAPTKSPDRTVSTKRSTVSRLGMGRPPGGWPSAPPGARTDFWSVITDCRSVNQAGRGGEVRQAERRAASRQAIVTAARGLFGPPGFAVTPVDQVAGAAGLAKGAVYHHFPGKDALFEAVFEAA